MAEILKDYAYYGFLFKEELTVLVPSSLCYVEITGPASFTSARHPP